MKFLEAEKVDKKPQNDLKNSSKNLIIHIGRKNALST